MSTSEEIAKQSHSALAQKMIEKYEGNMTYMFEWFREDLPLEDRESYNMKDAAEAMCKEAQREGSIMQEEHINKDAKPFTQIVFEKPPKPARESVLIFSDRSGYAAGIIDNAPEGRIGFKKILDGTPESYTLEDVKAQMVRKEGWDKVIFCPPCDLPESNDPQDIIDFQSSVVKLFYYVVKVICDEEDMVRNLAVVCRGAFTDDPEVHEEVGLRLISSSMFFGHVNTTRMELSLNIQYIDVDYHMKPRWWLGAGASQAGDILPKLASECFRNYSFGHNSVRLHHTGRYVCRQMPTPAYEVDKVGFRMPTRGIIVIAGGNGALGLVMGEWLINKAEEQSVTGIEIQFASRSMKISDQNIMRWLAIEKKASKLGIKVLQTRLDMSSQDAMDDFIAGVTPNLAGFIHSAGVLRDQMIMNLTWEMCEDVFNSKHRAALYLQESLERYENPNLEIFWNFSSVAVVGNPGQWNYSGSNACLDAISRHRTALKKVGMTVQWGAWGEVGMAANLDEASKRRIASGPSPQFTNAEGLRGLEHGLMTGLPYFSVFKYNLPALFATNPSDEHPIGCYMRNFTSEFCPPFPSVAELKNSYSLMRSFKWPYFQQIEDKRSYNEYILPQLVKRYEVDDDGLIWD